MNNYFKLCIGNILVNNLILIRFLGICPFLGISQKIKTSVRMGIATLFVMILTSICTWLVNNFILLPFNLSYLQILVFIFIIAVVVQIIELIIRKINLILYYSFGIFLPLITTNCAILGITLIDINEKLNFLQSILYNFCAAFGFLLVMVLFSSIRERLNMADIPEPFKGSPIALITAGLMSLAFMGFTGLIKT